MISRYVAVVLASLSCALAASGQTSTTESFSPSTGAMDVNYAGYLSQHDVVYNSENTNPLWGQMVGNGRVGAMVWSANGITMQVGAVDTSEETAFSGGLLNLYTSPGMDTGYTTYQQRLSLYNGTLTTTYDSNRTVTIMGSPNSELMGIHVVDTRTNVTSVTLDLSIWNTSGITSSYGDVPNITTWQTVSTYANSTGIGLSRGQADPNNFGYTLAATVEGASFTTQTVNSNDVRLIITPTSNYTIWFTCATRLNAANNNSVTQAQTNLANAVSTGYASILSNYESWWNAYWAKFFVQYSNSSGAANYLENMYYYYTYLIACGGYANYPFHFINGDFSAVQDQHALKWGYAYWYWNERDVYNSFLASNHPEILEGLNNLYSRNLSALEAYTTTRFGFNGAWIPETMGWNADPSGTMDSSYTINIYSSGTEAAQNMYLIYKYTNNTTYLTTVAYPFMRQICMFYVNELSKNSSGQYYMAVSNSHETYWNVQDAITDLLAVRTLFPEAIAEANALGQDSTLVTQWQNVLNNLVAYPSNGTAYLPNDPPAAPTHNDENVVSEMLWPYSVTGIGYSDFSLIDSAYVNRPFPYGNVWSPDAIQAARLGLGDSAYDGMVTMLNNYQSYPNGRTNNTNGEFEYMGVHLSAMNEQLLQSYNDVIRVFPAQPSDTSFVSSFTLAAKDGFLVSSERGSSGIKYVGIDSLYGNTASVYNPWGTQAIDVRNMSTNAVILTSSSAEFSFPTAANTVYVVERTSEPFSSYSHLQLTGTGNGSAKTLPGTSCTLGIGQGQSSTPEGPYGGTAAAVPGTVMAENYDTGGQGTGYSVSSVNGSDNGYRSDGVDLETATAPATGNDLGWSASGQWFRYTVNVATAGTYKVSFLVASPTAVTDAFHLSNSSGTNLSGSIAVPATGGYQTWVTVTATATLPAGTQTLTLNEDAGGWNIDSIAFAAVTTGEGSYPGPSAAAIPGTVLNENYDTGGQGVAYNITSTNGTDNTYRSQGVDLETATAPATGNDLGWSAAGQWFKYTVNASTAGSYTVSFLVASPTAVTDAFHLSNSSGTNLSGSVAVPATGGYQTWTTVTANITLSAGTQTLTLDDDAAGWNIDSMAFAAVTTGEGPYPGPAAAAVPGTVMAENYDTGGQGVAYNVTSTNGTANTYRSQGVDLEPATAPATGNDLGWSAAGQWFRYTVNVSTAGSYTVSFLVASPTAFADAFHLSNSSGTNLSGSVAVPATGGYQTWVTVKANVTLPAGQQTLTLSEDAGGWNIDSMAFASGTTGTPVIQIDCGGAASGAWVADTDFTGGTAVTSTNAITTSGVTNPAPQAVYQSNRYNAPTYTIGGLTAGTSYTVRLHFAETYWTAAGQREFNLSINGAQVLTDFDIFATAGGENIATVKQFTATANSSGQIVITSTNVIDNAQFNGIEVDH
jgi:alpha-L-fucosidase 2